ncbi:MAG TPA: LamG-like jellyroll fold domain-containing protein [Sedimentisphaerales bacterium]|nr:LamG-like jellyroll fold domain-containing protein [Sedimentisphaerales bacterium]
MSKKLIYLTSFIFVLGLVNTGIVRGVDLDTDPALVGWWTFDEGSGNIAADSSGNGNDGTLNGPVEWTTEGSIGGALKFTGPYNYVLVQDSPSLDMTNAITIAAWINPSWTGNNRIMQKSSGGGDNQYRLLKEWGDNLVFHLPGLSPDRLEFPGLPPIGKWTHLAATYDGSSMKVYYDGVVVGEQDSSGQLGTSDGTLCIGTKHETAPGGDEYNGMLDDIRIYNRALTQSEIKRLGGNPKASGPAPEDRAIHENTWANLAWTTGAFATSHDVYFGEKLDDVKVGTADTLLGNQTESFLIVGFPGFAYPDGLVTGTTYYWRVDEVNEASSDSPWTGEVWRFTVPPLTAWKPTPPENARLVDPETDLSWSPGWGAKMHTVYFGDNFDDVNNATGGVAQMPATYALDPLEMGKTYYWRVDEFDAKDTYKGNIWSFTTGDASIGGIKGEYFNNLTLSGTPILTRIEPGIDYIWGGEAPGPGVDAPLYSVRWTGVLNVPYTETYIFDANVFSAVRLWVNDQPVIENWMPHHMAIEYRGEIDLEVGTVPIVMEISNISGGGYGGGGNMRANLFWSNPSLEKEIIPQTALLLPVWAARSNPPNGAVDVKQTSILSWSPGDYAASHQVYFGTDENAVLNAATGSPEDIGTKDLGSESYDPGQLDWDTTYYWRVDEVNDTNPGSPWAGDVWSFKTANFPVIDDFEYYNDLEPDNPESNNIFYTWLDGFEDPANGSLVGYEFPPFTERIIVHGGKQSMPLYYDNSVTHSEVAMTLNYPTDWTEGGVTALTIWFYGNPANAAETLYVALNGTAIVTHDNPDAAQIATWIEWIIDLQAFADQGVDLTNVNTIALGLGDKNNPQPGGTGTMYFDDIALH